MEEQGPAGGAERQVAKLVEDDEIGVGEPGCDLAGFALKLLLFESVDKFDGGEEADTLAVMLDGLDADRGGEMRLARAGAADQDDIVGVFQELAAMELTRERYGVVWRRSRRTFLEVAPSVLVAGPRLAEVAPVERKVSEIKLNGIELPPRIRVVGGSSCATFNACFKSSSALPRSPTSARETTVPRPWYASAKADAKPWTSFAFFSVSIPGELRDNAAPNARRR